MNEWLNEWTNDLNEVSSVSVIVLVFACSIVSYISGWTDRRQAQIWVKEVRNWLTLNTNSDALVNFSESEAWLKHPVPSHLTASANSVKKQEERCNSSPLSYSSGPDTVPSPLRCSPVTHLDGWLPDSIQSKTESTIHGMTTIRPCCEQGFFSGL